MSKARINRLLLPALVLVASAGLRAGDEDLSPSAYQVFDPETGFMVPAESLHDPSTNHPASTSPPSAAAAAHEEVERQEKSGPPLAIVGGVTLVIALLAAVLFRHRARA